MKSVPSSPPPARPTPREVRWGIGIVLLALLLRAAWAAVVPVVPISDSAAYDLYARNVVLGNGYGLDPNTPSVFWPPGTSVLHAVMYQLADVSVPPTDQPYAPLISYACIEILNTVLGVGIVVLGMLLAWRRLGPRAGIVAGLLLALWPMAIGFTSVLQSEIPCTFFLLAGMLAFDALRERPVARAITAGLLFAAASYVRPTMLLVPVLLFGIEFLTDPRRTRVFLTALATGLVMALAIAPWTIRNYRVFHAFVPISANSGSNLWMGNNPDSKGFYMPEPEEYRAWGEVERDRKLGQIAKAYMLQDPLRTAKNTLVKLVRLHERQTIGIGWNEEGFKRLGREDLVKPLKIVSTAYWYALLAAACVGIILHAGLFGPWRTLTSPFLAVWVYTAGLHAIYVIQDRYTFPFTPMVAILAALPAAALLDRFVTRQRPPASAYAEL